MTYILGLQQLLAAFITVGVGYHFRVDTSMVSARKNGHRHSGVQCPLQLMCNLFNLFMRACAEENFGDSLLHIAFLVFVLDFFSCPLPFGEACTSTQGTR